MIQVAQTAETSGHHLGVTEVLEVSTQYLYLLQR